LAPGLKVRAAPRKENERQSEVGVGMLFRLENSSFSASVDEGKVDEELNRADDEVS